MQNLVEISFLLPEVISLHDLTKLWADTDATNAQEKGTEAQKRGAVLTCPPRCPHYLDTEFDEDFIFVVRHDRIRVLTKPWAV